MRCACALRLLAPITPTCPPLVICCLFPSKVLTRAPPPLPPPLAQETVPEGSSSLVNEKEAEMVLQVGGWLPRVGGVGR